MITIPTGWVLDHLPDAMSLTHPRGSKVAHILYRERAGRLERLVPLAHKILASFPQLICSSLGPVERTTTEEGELAATVTATCTEGGRPVEVLLGFVLTDDFFTSTTALIFDASVAAEVRVAFRELVRHDNLALGARRRRFQYRPPADWQPVRRSLATEWIPPDYPSNDVVLLVYPANPVVMGRATFGGAHLYLESLGWRVISVSPMQAGTSAQGIAYEQQDVVFQRTEQLESRTRIALLSDRAYQYPLELREPKTTGTEANFQVLRSVIDSIVPISPMVISPFEHWID